jgi:hypothetical protein
MALNDRSDQVVRAFVRSDLPSDVDISDNFRKYLTGEFDLIQQVLSEANDSAPQVSEAAPASLRKGMVRYAVAPWNPLGTGYTGYVYYNGSAWVKGIAPLTAADIANVPAGGIAATDVQAAINELDTEKLRTDHGNFMSAQLGFTQLNTTPAAVEGFQWAPFIYVTTPAAESIGATAKTKTAGAALTTVMEISDSVYFYDRQFPVYLQWTDGGATAGPALVLQRNSATPAAADQIGEIRFEGRDSTNANTLYAEIIGRIDNATDTTEQGSLGIYARNGGAGTAEQARIGYNGTTLGAPTGGMKGSGTLNVAGGIYNNGTLMATPQAWTRLAAVATTSGTSVTIAAAGTIPGSAKQIAILVKAVSLNTDNTAPTMIFTNGGGDIAAGYNVRCAVDAGAALSPTNHITLGSAEADAAEDAANTIVASLLLTRMDTAVYMVQGQWFSSQYVNVTGNLEGYLDFSAAGALTGLKMSTNGGVATYDAGSVYVAYLD